MTTGGGLEASAFLIILPRTMIVMSNMLPSGHHYRFESITINPMYFAQVLEYEENCPSDPVEKYYFDYCVLKMDDPNVDDLLLPDLEYAVFLKKAVSIGRDASFNATIVCPVCGARYSHRITVPTDIKYTPIDPTFTRGFQIMLGGQPHAIKIPTMREFLSVFNNYRRVKKLTDMKLIKLIALFRDSGVYPSRYEDLVVHSTYNDISTLTMLSDLCYEQVAPIETFCPICNKGLSESEKKRGTVIGLDGLITNFFRTILENNRASEYKVLS